MTKGGYFVNVEKGEGETYLQLAQALHDPLPIIKERGGTSPALSIGAGNRT
jgi:hypothetical protein